jgi:hypothetical protein
MEQVVVSGLTYDKKQAKITMTGVPDMPGITASFGSVSGGEYRGRHDPSKCQPGRPH